MHKLFSYFITKKIEAYEFVNDDTKLLIKPANDNYCRIGDALKAVGETRKRNDAKLKRDCDEADYPDEASRVL